MAKKYLKKNISSGSSNSEMRNPVEVGEQLFTQRYRNWRRDLAVMAAGKRNKNPGKTADLPEEMPEKAGLEPRMVRFEPVMLMLRLRVGEGSSSPFNWGVASRPFKWGRVKQSFQTMGDLTCICTFHSL